MASEKKPNLGKVMVIGGCGFLGHHVVNLLLERYTSEPSVIDLRCSVNRRPGSDGVNYFEADITNADNMLSIFQKVKPDVVIHTASPAVQATTKVADALFKKVNVDGTRVVVETCQKTGVKALVYTSSASILSNNKDDLINADERWPIIRGKDQTEYYSETKAEAEELVLKANRDGSSKLLTAAIRPSGIVGEGDKMVLYHMVNIFREKRSHWQIGDNNNMFDFTYVVNVAHAHLLAARALLHTSEANIMPLDHEKVDGEAFIVTNDSPIYFWDFARVIWNEAGSTYGTEHVWALPRELGLTLASLSELFYAIIRKSPTFTRQRVVYATMTRYYDISKAKRRLGYKPIVSLEDGLRRAVRWTIEQEKATAIKK